MTDRELKKLSRNDLLELLLDQAKEIDRLRGELDQANRKLSERRIELENAGSIAEAALQISGIFDAAQEACAIYQENIRQMHQHQEEICVRMEQSTKEKCSKMEQEARDKCEKMISDAQQLAEIYWDHIYRKDNDPMEPEIDWDDL